MHACPTSAPASTPRPATSTPPAEPAALPPFAHREPYGAYFERLADHPRPAAALRRLLGHIEADLDGTERLALWQALWRCARRLPAGERAAVARCLDGRHAPKLDWLDDDWDDPALIAQLATGAAREPALAGFVTALFASHGIDVVAQPQAHASALVLAGVRAALVTATAVRLEPAAIEPLQAAVVDACLREPARMGEGLALVFELALHGRDDDAATGALAQLIAHRQAHHLRAARVGAWLDGSAFEDDPDEQLPLQLSARWQGQWLDPAAWSLPGRLAAVAQAVRRPVPAARLQRLTEALEVDPAQAPASPSTAVRLLAALDRAYALAEGGADPVPVATPLLDSGWLAPPAVAALHRAGVRYRAAMGDFEGALTGLVAARRVWPTPAVRRAVAEVLPDRPALGADWLDEEPAWKRLLLDAGPALQRIAAFQLATLWTHGALEPKAPRRCQQLEAAHALWQGLAAHPPYAAAAAAALGSPAFTLVRPSLAPNGDADSLWIETPGACLVTIVFSCVYSHHRFTDVETLAAGLAAGNPPQHLLFVRNPQKNWYSDDSFEAVCTAVRERVLSRFDRGSVTCYYGSMGGHGALKVALQFGLRAVVFNPQTDLDLWAGFRAGERALLWGAEQHTRLDAWPVAAWERVPLYVACGSATPDREAFAVLVAQLRQCRHASAILEKFDDPDHAGLMGRIVRTSVPQSLQRIGTRLDALAGDDVLPGMAALAGAAVDPFWATLDEAAASKVEVQVREGVLWWQPSQGCDTR